MALAESASRVELAPSRESFSHIPEVLPLPNLIQTQTDSFNWFVTSGLRELLDEITPISELYLLYGIAHRKLEETGIKIFRSYVNEYCTSLEMAGASLTLLKVDDELKELLLAPAEVSNRVF